MVQEGTVKDFFTRLLTDRAFDPFPFHKKDEEELKGDAQPREVASASAGQVGIPLEHRFILEQPSARTLFAVLKRYLDQTRELNTRHMDPEKRHALIAEARGEPKLAGSEVKDARCKP
jgi:hypothetical protein